MGECVHNNPSVELLLDELAHWHLEYERTADPDDFWSAGSKEAAQLSARVGQLLEALGRPVSLR